MRKSVIVFSALLLLFATRAVYALSYYQNSFDDSADVAELSVSDSNSSLSVSLSGTGDPVAGALKTVETLGGEDDKVYRVVEVPDDEYIYVSVCVYAPDFQAPAVGSNGLVVWAGGSPSGWYHDNLTAGNSDFEQLSIYVQKVASSPPDLEVLLYTPQGTSYWDDLIVSTEPPPPCASIGGPPPTETATPNPAATPTTEPLSNPLFESGPGIPQPFEIPPVDPENTINFDPFWDYQTLSDIISIILTLFLLLKQNLIMQAVVLVALFGLALVWMVRVVRSRPQNI